MSQISPPASPDTSEFRAERPRRPGATSLPDWGPLPALLFVALLPLLVSACAGPRVVDHSFGFDIRRAIPAVEILDYRYGESRLPVFAPEQSVKEGRPFFFSGVSGPMRLGDFLYVKWRIKETGEIFEDRVDLRERLPRQMERQRVYLDIGGRQLYVYVISEQRYPPKQTPCPPSLEDWKSLDRSEKSSERIFARFCHYKQLRQIYPDRLEPLISPRGRTD